jgi:hypothetical protein
MLMYYPQSMTTIAMQHNSKHYFATQNNRPGMYSQLNKNGTRQADERNSTSQFLTTHQSVPHHTPCSKPPHNKQ